MKLPFSLWSPRISATIWHNKDHFCWAGTTLSRARWQNLWSTRGFGMSRRQTNQHSDIVSKFSRCSGMSRRQPNQHSDSLWLTTASYEGVSDPPSLWWTRLWSTRSSSDGVSYTSWSLTVETYTNHPKPHSFHHSLFHPAMDAFVWRIYLQIYNA